MSMRDGWTSDLHGGSPQGLPSSKRRVSNLSSRLFCSLIMANVLVIKQNVYPGFQMIFFSYRYRWLVAKPRQRDAKCRGERAFNINRKHGLFHPRYFENGPLEPGYKMCSLQKKKKTLTWSPEKRSRPALTYHELLSNFIFPLDLDNGARIIM